MIVSGPLRTLDRWTRALWGKLRPASAEWEAHWSEALRSACETLATSRGMIDAIDLRGERWGRANPSRLRHLSDLARRIAADHGVGVEVSFADGAPLIRVTRRARPRMGTPA